MVASFSQRVIAGFARLSAGPDDPAEARLQKTVLLLSCLIGMVVTVMWAAVYLFFREPEAAAISLLYTAVTFVATLRYALTRRYRFLLYSQLTLGLVLPFLQTIALGGILDSGAVILWALTSPLGALLLLGPRPALRWWLAFLALVMLSGAAGPVARAGNNLPAWLITVLLVGNISAVASMAIVMLMYFIQQKNLAFSLLRAEEEKAEALLLNVLPVEIAAILKNESRTIAERFETASILFADLAGFTEMTARAAPEEMVEVLNTIFSHFDGLVEKYGVEKIRTIGDNYMVAAGVPGARPDHARVLAALALEMIEYAGRHPVVQGMPVQFRIGINSGPVIGGVIGRKKFVYDVWGEAVNIASRMESQGLPQKIQISKTTYELIRDGYRCEPRGKVAIKGVGEMETWFLEGKLSGG